MSNEIDVAAETGREDPTTTLRAKARAKAEAPTKAAGGATARQRVARETPIQISLNDPWTGETTSSWTITSLVPDGPAQGVIVRMAAELASGPMDQLSADDRWWFRALARAEVQIRSVSGTGFPAEMAGEKGAAARRNHFINLLWEDGELLGLVNGRLVEHEARFRLGDAREGEGAPKFARVVVSALGAPNAASAAGR